MRELVVLFVGVAAIIGGVMACALWADRTACHQTSRAMGFDSQWSATPGVPCLIRVDGHWMPLESYKVVGVRR